MKEQLQECHDKGYLTDDFAILAMSLAEKRINRKKNQNIPFSAREEAYSTFCYKLVTKWQKISPDKSPNSYINLMAHNCLMDVLRSFNRDLKRVDSIQNKNNIEKDVKNVFVTPQKVDIRTLSRKERASIKREVIKLLRNGISKSEIERQTQIPRNTIIRWHNKHKELDQKFYQLDRRERRK